MKKVLIALTFLAVTAALAASSYRVPLYRATTLNGTEFKAGECKVELRENKLVLKQGKTIAEATVKVETSAQKFPDTTVSYAGAGSATELQEIRLGGTNTKVIVEQSSVAVRGSK